MYPFRTILQIGGQSIEFGPYGLFLFLAVVLVLAGSIWLARSYGYKAKTTLLLLVCLLASSLIGARLLYVLSHWEIYQSDVSRIFSLDAEGFSLYGGILLAILTGYVVCRLVNIKPFAFADLLMPLAGIGIAVYRIGCFLQGCCFGKTTDLPWGVTFPMLSPAHLYQMSTYGSFFDVKPVHPTQLYELLAALILAALSFWLLSQKRKDGTVLLIFLAGFTLFRMWNDTLRVEPDGFSLPVFFYPVLYAAILLLVGITMFRIWKVQKIPVTN